MKNDRFWDEADSLPHLSSFVPYKKYSNVICRSASFFFSVFIVHIFFTLIMSPSVRLKERARETKNLPGVGQCRSLCGDAGWGVGVM